MNILNQVSAVNYMVAYTVRKMDVHLKVNEILTASWSE